MSELTNLIAKQNEESYQLGKKHGAIEELKKLEEKIIRNSRPYREKLVIDVATCQLLIKERIEELKGEE